jgi:hypothetical protein
MAERVRVRELRSRVSRSAARRSTGALMAKYSPTRTSDPHRGTTSHQPSRLSTTDGRTICRKISTIRVGEC